MRDIHNYLLVVCFPLNCEVSESVGFSFLLQTVSGPGVDCQQHQKPVMM